MAQHDDLEVLGPAGADCEPGHRGSESVQNAVHEDPASTGVIAGQPSRLGFGTHRLTIAESSVLLADRLDTAGVDHTLTIIEDATHDDMTPEGQQDYIDFIVNG